MKKICLIIPYFGKFPKWFNFYLKSIEYNPKIDWLMFTDCGIPKKHPQNIKFIPFTIQDFNKLASIKLNLKINIKNSFKLCDFKPAYGKIFEDYLKTYDFWGYGDIDLIYGDIKKFITKEILAKNEIITPQKNYVVGHLTFFKNIKKINLLYQQSKDYKKVFQNNKNYNFSECGYTFKEDIFSKKPLNESPKTESISHTIRKLLANKKLKIFHKTLIKEDSSLTKRDLFIWSNGELKNAKTNQKFLYLHFRKFKHNPKFLIPNYNKIPNKFYITLQGIFTKKQIKGIRRGIKIIANYLNYDNLKRKIDSKIGQMGIILKKYYPKLYRLLKK